jgi:ABC-type amino acid transport system permease subunit
LIFVQLFRAYFVLPLLGLPITPWQAGVLELMNQARSVANLYYRYLEPMTLVGAFFLAISIPSALLLRYLERHFRAPEQ